MCLFLPPRYAARWAELFAPLAKAVNGWLGEGSAQAQAQAQAHCVHFESFSGHLLGALAIHGCGSRLGLTRLQLSSSSNNEGEGEGEGKGHRENGDGGGDGDGPFFHAAAAAMTYGWHQLFVSARRFVLVYSCTRVFMYSCTRGFICRINSVDLRPPPHFQSILLFN